MGKVRFIKLVYVSLFTLFMLISFTGFGQVFSEDQNNALVKCINEGKSIGYCFRQLGAKGAPIPCGQGHCRESEVVFPLIPAILKFDYGFNYYDRGGS
ncbi:MAG: hypothetical protein AAF696_38300, partial [Bacteroidota bacterium]